MLRWILVSISLVAVISGLPQESRIYWFSFIFPFVFAKWTYFSLSLGNGKMQSKENITFDDCQGELVVGNSEYCEYSCEEI